MWFPASSNVLLFLVVTFWTKYCFDLYLLAGTSETMRNVQEINQWVWPFKYVGGNKVSSSNLQFAADVKKRNKCDLNPAQKFSLLWRDAKLI